MSESCEDFYKTIKRKKIEALIRYLLKEILREDPRFFSDVREYKEQLLEDAKNIRSRMESEE